MERWVEALLIALALSAVAYSIAPQAAYAGCFKVKDAYWASYQLGGSSVLHVVLEYNGSATASNLEATLRPGPVATSESSTARFEDEVKPGGQVLFSFTLPLPLTPTVSYYEAKLEVSYELAGVERSEGLSVPITVAGLPSLVVTASPVELKRGAVTEVWLTVKNEGTGVARLVSLSASPASPFIVVVGGGVLSMGLIPPGGVSQGVVRLHTQPTSPDSVSLTTSIAYLDQFGNTYASAATIGFTVKLSPAMPLTLSITPSVVVPDRVNHVKLHVVNQGELDVYNVSITLTPSRGVVVLGVNYLYFSEVEAGGSSQADLDLYIAPSLQGAVVLVAQLTYRDAEGRSYLSQLQLGLRLGGGAEFKLLQTSYTPSTVFPGDEGVVLQALLANLGPYSAEEVNVTLNPPQGLSPAYAGSTIASLGTVAAGEARQLVFKVDLSEEVKPGRYELPLIVSYEGGSQQLSFPLDVSKKARFRLESFHSDPARLKRDERGVRLSLTLRNVEDVEAEQVRVRLLGSTFTGTTVAYLGTMAGGSTATASFDVDVSPTAPLGEVNVEVEVLWAQRGRLLSQKLWITVEVEEGAFAKLLREVQGSPLMVKLGLVGLAIAAAAVIAAAFKRRARA